MNAQNAHTKKNVQKVTNYRILYEPFNPFFIERKKAFLSQKGQKIYKLRAIHSEGAFSQIKENTEI